MIWTRKGGAFTAVALPCSGACASRSKVWWEVLESNVRRLCHGGCDCFCNHGVLELLHFSLRMCSITCRCVCLRSDVWGREADVSLYLCAQIQPHGQVSASCSLGLRATQAGWCVEISARVVNQER